MNYLKSELKDCILHALQNAKGDDLERAQRAFRGMSEKQLDEQHGASGKTRREVLQEYIDHRNLNLAATELAQSL